MNKPKGPSFLSLFWKTFKKTKINIYAAAISYTAIFAIVPFLILVVAGSGHFLERQLTQAEILHKIGDLSSPRMAQAISGVLGEATGKGAKSLSLASIFLLIFSGTRLFSITQRALGEIFKGSPPPKKEILHEMEKQFFSFLFFIGAGLILTSSFFLEASLDHLQNFIHHTAPAFEFYISLEGFSSLITTFFFFASCAVVYRFLPRAAVLWKDVWLGSLVTTVAFFLGKEGLAIYFNYSPIGSFYGTAGSFVIFLLWIYFTSLVFLAGAEVCQVYAETYGSKSPRGLFNQVKEFLEKKIGPA